LRDFTNTSYNIVKKKTTTLKSGLAQWLMPIIPTTQGQKSGGSQFKVTPDKKLVRTPSQSISQA
jgi:hypothetical protein